MFAVIFTLFTLLATCAAFAQDTLPTPDVPEWVNQIMVPLFGWIASNPKLAVVLATLYVISIILKIVFSAAEQIIIATPSQSDDALWSKIKKHWAYKWVCYLLDLIIRAKLPKAPKA